MTKDKIKDFHWLLLMSKNAPMKYPEQREKWNALQAEFKAKNKGLIKIPDHTGPSLSIFEDTYQD